jgi:hypothetical protein
MRVLLISIFHPELVRGGAQQIARPSPLSLTRSMTRDPS